MNRRFNLAENQEPEPPQEARMGFGVFFILMLAFPVQYYLSDSYGGTMPFKHRVQTPICNFSVGHFQKSKCSLIGQGNDKFYKDLPNSFIDNEKPKQYQ